MPTNELKNRIQVVARRMIYERLIKGTKYENELKNKDDKHIIQVLKLFGIQIKIK